MKICLMCDNILSQKQKKYCSHNCLNIGLKIIKKEKIESWLRGENDGRRGKTATAYWIRKYIFEYYNNECCKCGWGEINPYTKKIPLELNHKDGDYTNNKFENLDLLCPNCHSLTDSYKGANKKGGRPRSKYYRGL